MGASSEPSGVSKEAGPLSSAPTPPKAALITRTLLSDAPVHRRDPGNARMGIHADTQTDRQTDWQVRKTGSQTDRADATDKADKKTGRQTDRASRSNRRADKKTRRQTGGTDKGDTQTNRQWGIETREDNHEKRSCRTEHKRAAEGRTKEKQT